MWGLGPDRSIRKLFEDADDSELVETIALTVLELRLRPFAKLLRQEHQHVPRVWEMAGACSNGGLRVLLDSTLKLEDLREALRAMGAEAALRSLEAAAPLYQRSDSDRGEYFDGLSEEERYVYDHGISDLYSDAILPFVSDYVRDRKNLFLELPNVEVPRFFKKGRGSKPPRESSSSIDVAKWLIGMGGYAEFHEIRYPHGGRELFTGVQKLPRKGVTLAGFHLPLQRRDTDESLRLLAKWSGRSGIESITLEKNRIGDAGLMALQAFPNLIELGLNGAFIGDDAMGRIAALRKLTRLDLSRTRVTEAGLQVLKGHPALLELDLSRMPVSLQGAKALAEIPLLKDVEVGTIEPEGKRLLLDARPGLTIR